jgi:hypothetical protein
MVSKRATVASQVNSFIPQRTTFLTVTTSSAAENSFPTSQIGNEATAKTPSGESPSGRWLSKRIDDDWETRRRPECVDPPDDFSLSGKVLTFVRNSRRPVFTTITGEGWTSTVTAPPDPNRPPPRPSVVTPDWVTASMFTTLSCRQVWNQYFDIVDSFSKREIADRIVEDLEAAIRR